MSFHSLKLSLHPTEPPYPSLKSVSTLTSLILLEHQHSWRFSSWTISMDSLLITSSHFPNPTDGFCIHLSMLSFLLSVPKLESNPNIPQLQQLHSWLFKAFYVLASSKPINQLPTLPLFTQMRHSLPSKWSALSQPPFLCSCHFFHMDFHFSYVCIHPPPFIHLTNINEGLLCTNNPLGAGNPVMIRIKSLCSWSLLLVGRL